MVQVSLSTSTNFDGNINALVEDQGTELTVRFDLDEPAPAGGLRVFVDGNVEQIVNRLDLPTFTFNPVTENINPASFGTDFDNTGFVVTIDEGATFGSFTIPIFDNAEPDTFLPATFDGLVAATFSLVAAEDVSEEDASNITDISEYDISGNNASSIVFFADDASQLPDIPVVSFSTTPDVISESEGTALVLNFTVDGDIPEGGITVNLEGDTPEILQQFLAPDGDGAVQTRVTNEGNILYRFDTSFEPDNSNFGNIVGGSLNVFALEDGDPSETNSNPEAAGDGFLSNFSFTITEANASITLPVVDDVVQEEDVTFTYTLAPGVGYEVDGEANSGTFTVTDGVEFPDTPVVGVSGNSTTLNEVEQTALTLTFTTEGDIPDEGLVVLLEGAPRSIAEFDVNASNPRDPEDTITIEGPVATGGNIVGTNEVAGALLFRIFEPTATLSVPVFDDSVLEGSETLNFELIDGEAYEVDPGASTIDLTIEDGDSPVVSFSTTPGLISEAEGTSLVLNFTVDGEIPEGGITVNLEGDAPEILQQFIAPDGDGAVQTRVTDEGNILYRFDTSFEPDNSNFGNIVGGSLNVFALEDGDPSETNSNPEAAGDGFLSNFSFTITEATASITLPVLDDVVQEDDVTFTYTLAPGAGYEINPDADSGTFTVTDGVEFPDTPVVGVTATPTTLVESEQTVLTLTFTTEGDIPAEGLVVLLEGAPRSIAEFDVNASNPRDPEDTITLDGPVATGGNIVGTDEVAGALFFRITEPTATLSVEVFDDDVAEGEEILDFELIDGEAYSVDPGASSLSLTINDGDGSGLDLLDTPFTRFQNSSIPGTYVYATGDEVDNIRANQPGFVEEGVAFSAAIAPDDDLIAFSRLESNQLPGTFLYVGDEELASINADPNFSNAFTNQGVAFYVYGAGAGEETPFNRFQNSGVPGTYVYATGAEADSIRANFPGFIDEGVAFEAAI